MNKLYQKFWLVLLLAFATPLHAALTIEITGGAGNQIPLAIVPFGAENTLPQSITAIVGSDLARSGLFRLVDHARHHGVRADGQSRLVVLADVHLRLAAGGSGADVGEQRHAGRGRPDQGHVKVGHEAVGQHDGGVDVLD